MLNGERLPHGNVCGIDPSEIMFRQAFRRNRREVRAGRVDLRVGTASELPWRDESFDAAISLNNVLLWEPLDRSMQEVRRVLKRGARLVLGVHAWAARGQSGSRAASLEAAEREVRSALEAASFSEIEGCHRRFRIGRALFLFAKS